MAEADLSGDVEKAAVAFAAVGGHAHNWALKPSGLQGIDGLEHLDDNEKARVAYAAAFMKPARRRASSSSSSSSSSPGGGSGGSERSSASLSHRLTIGAGVLAGCARFQQLDRKEWYLDYDVKEELQQTYCLENMDKCAAAPFQLSHDAVNLLHGGAKAIAADWDTHLLRVHPGFNSYSNIVGLHDNTEQKKHTRVVGPASKSWERFYSKYPWFRSVLAEIEAHMDREIALNYESDLRSLGSGKKSGSGGSSSVLSSSGAAASPAAAKMQRGSGSTPQKGSAVKEQRKKPAAPVIDCAPMGMMTLYDMHILRQLSEAPKEASRAPEPAAPSSRDLLSSPLPSFSSTSSSSASECVTPRLESSSSSSSSSSPPPPPPSVGSATPVASRGSNGGGKRLDTKPSAKKSSSAPQDLSLRSGAVFNDHQDRHGEIHGETLRWTVTLLVASTGSPTGFFQWNARARDGTKLKGVIPYAKVGSAVLFPSTAWHRSVIPAGKHWPFEAMKFSLFYVEKTGRSCRYESRE